MQLVCAGRGHPSLERDDVLARQEYAELRAEFDIIDSREYAPGERTWGLRSPLHIEASTREAWAKLCGTSTTLQTLNSWLFGGSEMKSKPLSAYSTPNSYARRLKKLAKKTLTRNNDKVTPKARIALLVASILKMSRVYPLALASEVLMFCKDVDEGEARIFHSCFGIGYARQQLRIPPGSEREEMMTPERLAFVETRVAESSGALGALTDVDPRVIRALLDVTYAPDLPAVAVGFTKLMIAVDPGGIPVEVGPLLSFLQDHKAHMLAEDIMNVAIDELCDQLCVPTIVIDALTRGASANLLNSSFARDQLCDYFSTYMKVPSEVLSTFLEFAAGGAGGIQRLAELLIRNSDEEERHHDEDDTGNSNVSKPAPYIVRKIGDIVRCRATMAKPTDDTEYLAAADELVRIVVDALDRHETTTVFPVPRSALSAVVSLAAVEPARSHGLRDESFFDEGDGRANVGNLGRTQYFTETYMTRLKPLIDQLGLDEKLVRVVVCARHRDTLGTINALCEVLDAFPVENRVSASYARGLMNLSSFGSEEGVEDIANAFKFDPDIAEALVLMTSGGGGQIIRSESVIKMLSKLGTEAKPMRALMALCKNSFADLESVAEDLGLGIDAKYLRALVATNLEDEALIRKHLPALTADYKIYDDSCAADTVLIALGKVAALRRCANRIRKISSHNEDFYVSMARIFHPDDLDFALKGRIDTGNIWAISRAISDQMVHGVSVDSIRLLLALSRMKEDAIAEACDITLVEYKEGNEVKKKTRVKRMRAFLRKLRRSRPGHVHSLDGASANEGVRDDNDMEQKSARVRMKSTSDGDMQEMLRKLSKFIRERHGGYMDEFICDFFLRTRSGNAPLLPKMKKFCACFRDDARLSPKLLCSLVSLACGSMDVLEEELKVFSQASFFAQLWRCNSAAKWPRVRSGIMYICRIAFRHPSAFDITMGDFNPATRIHLDLNVVKAVAVTIWAGLIPESELKEDARMDESTAAPLATLLKTSVSSMISCLTLCFHRSNVVQTFGSTRDLCKALGCDKSVAAGFTLIGAEVTLQELKSTLAPFFSGLKMNEELGASLMYFIRHCGEEPHIDSLHTICVAGGVPEDKEQLVLVTSAVVNNEHSFYSSNERLVLFGRVLGLVPFEQEITSGGSAASSATSFKIHSVASSGAMVSPAGEGTSNTQPRPRDNGLQPSRNMTRAQKHIGARAAQKYVQERARLLENLIGLGAGNAEQFDEVLRYLGCSEKHISLVTVLVEFFAGDLSSVEENATILCEIMAKLGVPAGMVKLVIGLIVGDLTRTMTGFGECMLELNEEATALVGLTKVDLAAVKDLMLTVQSLLHATEGGVKIERSTLVWCANRLGLGEEVPEALVVLLRFLLSGGRAYISKADKGVMFSALGDAIGISGGLMFELEQLAQLLLNPSLASDKSLTFPTITSKLKEMIVAGLVQSGTVNEEEAKIVVDTMFPSSLVASMFRFLSLSGTSTTAPPGFPDFDDIESFLQVLVQKPPLNSFEGAIPLVRLLFDMIQDPSQSFEKLADPDSLRQLLSVMLPPAARGHKVEMEMCVQVVSGLLSLMNGRSPLAIAEGFGVPREILEGLLCLAEGDLEGAIPLAKMLGDFSPEQVEDLRAMIKSIIAMTGTVGGNKGKGAEGLNLAGLDREEIFRMIDKNGSGTIDFSEFKELCKYFGITLNDQALMELFAESDSDASGELAFPEFDRKCLCLWEVRARSTRTDAITYLLLCYTFSQRSPLSPCLL